MNKFKEDIRARADKQREYRNQRKTVHRVGEKTMEPWQAAARHFLNRYELRDMYIAYGELRGKPAEVTCKNSKREFNRANIDAIKKQYAPDVLELTPPEPVIEPAQENKSILSAIKSLFF